MNELIPISDHNGKKAVDARLLHEFLGSKREFTTWIKDRIKKYGFIENQDYVSFDEIVKRETGATTLTQYVLTLDCAKELSMVEGNAKGKEARQYFISCENRLNEIAQKPLTSAQMFAMQARVNLEFENRVSLIETKVDAIIQKQQEAESELKALPVATEAIPDLPLRDKIRMLVNRYCSATGMLQQSVWDNIYQTLYYNYHVSVKSYSKAKNETWLDVADRKGFLDKMYIIVSNLLRDKGLVA